MVTFVPSSSVRRRALALEAKAAAEAAGIDSRDLAAMDEFYATYPVPRPRGDDGGRGRTTLEHAREVAGIDHLGLGGDFDGVEAMPIDLPGRRRLPPIARRAADRGWSADDLAQLTHRNICRVLHDAEDVAVDLRSRPSRSLARPTALGPAAAVSGLLEVVALHAADAERAEAGGADRIQLVGSLDHRGSIAGAGAGRSGRGARPRLPIRVLLRLREGYGTDGGRGGPAEGTDRARSASVGADGLVLGFLNGHTEVDAGVVSEVIGPEPDYGWTFDRADRLLHLHRPGLAGAARLPGLDQVLTAGSARGVAEGLDDLVARARADERARKLIMAGGGLQAEHVPWLVRAGVRAFHIGAAARPLGSNKAYVDPDLVRTWRTLIDDAVQRAEA